MPPKDSNQWSSKRRRGHNIKNQLGALQLLRTAQESSFIPVTQYPVDDTIPVKSWVFEKWPAGQGQFKPLRPEDERKAIQVLNRHLPFWDRIEITPDDNTGTEQALDSRPRLYHETHLPLPPRCWDARNRQEAAKLPGSPKPTKPFKPADIVGKKKVKRVRALNWRETEDKVEEAVERAEWESSGPVIIVPDLILTRPDGEMRRLQDPNLYVSRKDGGKDGCIC